MLLTAALTAATSLADLGAELSTAGVLQVASMDSATRRAPTLKHVDSLHLQPVSRKAFALSSRRLALGGGAGGILDPRRSSGVDGGVACVAGALLPGLGHAVLGAYLPRGLAFTSAFVATLIGGITALTHAQDSPRLRGQLLFAGFVLMLSADVLYLWSVVDALMISSRPRRTERTGPEHLLGRD